MCSNTDQCEQPQSKSGHFPPQVGQWGLVAILLAIFMFLYAVIAKMPLNDLSDSTVGWLNVFIVLSIVLYVVGLVLYVGAVKNFNSAAICFVLLVFVMSLAFLPTLAASDGMPIMWQFLIATVFQALALIFGHFASQQIPESSTKRE